MEIARPVHRHHLKTRKKGKRDDRVLECRGCREKIPGQISYWCSDCRCSFHEGCSKLALEINLFFHPCPILLSSTSPFICNSCFKGFSDVFTYKCEQCDFDICLQCAAQALSIDGETEKEQILHCCHIHPLTPLPIEPNSLLSCQICEMPCSFGPPWGCEQCNFHLHKPCLDFLPEMVQTKLDSQFTTWVLKTSRNNRCNGCLKLIRSNLAFRRVGKTGERLCILCCLVRRLIDQSSSSQIPKVINHFLHPCPDLKLILSPKSSDCNACLLNDHPFSYHCNSCDFFLCFDCAQLPHFRHWHPLKLLTNTGDTISTHICHICEKICSELFYSCVDLCQFYVHKSCMNSLPHKTIHLLLDPIVVLLHVHSFECTTCNSQCSGLTYYCTERKCMFCVRCVLWPEKALGDDGRFKSILHWHQLSPCETRIEDKRRTCFLCKEPCIAWTLSYKCSECALFFHKSCAELPIELDHPIHPQHHLTLTNRSSLLTNEGMACKLCLKSLSKKFPLYDLVYRCQQCDFTLDTQCATFRPSVEYKGHPHILYVVVNMHGNTHCRACGESCRGSCTIRCADQECDFSLHLHCGPLPRLISHISHVHPLMLKDYYVEDNGSDEFACHICEEKRDPRLQVYCCSQDCLMICEVKCVLNEVLPLLRGERGEVELRTPFPQVKIRVISCKSDFVEMMWISSSDSDEAEDWDQKTKHEFSVDELKDSFSDSDHEEVDSETEEVSEICSSLDEEVQSYTFSWDALSRFEKSLRTPAIGSLEEDLVRQYDGDIMTGDFALPEILGPIYDEFFGTYKIIDHGCKLKYPEKRFLIFVMCVVLHRMRITKVVDLTKETILSWLGMIRFVEKIGRFNVGILAKNISQVWRAHYYIQSKKIVDEKSSRLERELEQVSMYKAELRTKMDEAEARYQELKLMDKAHETYRVVGSRGPMKKVKSDALDIKWRTCYDSLVTYPENLPTL